MFCNDSLSGLVCKYFRIASVPDKTVITLNLTINSIMFLETRARRVVRYIWYVSAGNPSSRPVLDSASPLKSLTSPHSLDGSSVTIRSRT